MSKDIRRAKCVLTCCETNTLDTQKLQTRNIIISHSSEGQESGWFWPRRSREAAGKKSGRAATIRRFAWGGEEATKTVHSHGCWLEAAGLTTDSATGLLEWPHTWQLASPTVSDPRERERKRGKGRETDRGRKDCAKPLS